MDGDARRPTAPPTTDRSGPPYTVHVDYELPSPRLDAAPAEKGREDKPKPEPESKAEPAKPKLPRWRKLLYAAIGLAILAAIVVTGLLYWLDSRHYASTDDAFVDGHIAQIAPEIGGRVTRVAIDDYQHVTAGQVLVEIDPRNYQVKLEQAQAQRAQAAAQLQQALANLTSQQAAVDQARANLRAAQADLQRASTDYNRYRAVDPKAVARTQIDAASASARSAQARLDAEQQGVNAAEANVAVQRAQIEAARANLKAADVAVANAELQLSYATVTAPRDGQVARRTVELGNYVNPGQALLAVVGDDRWITANFKETQLDGMQPGQPVTIAVDACPDHGLTGTVVQIQPGSGSVFSSLPAENATGNYVKVVQRVPVKIAIDHEDAVRCPLAPGMSVSPRVKVR